MKDIEAIIQTGTWVLIASACVYISWFKSEIFRRYLGLWSRSQFVGRNWMNSNAYFWLMRCVTIFMLLVTLTAFVAALLAPY
jgi:hypothetical protein